VAQDPGEIERAIRATRDRLTVDIDALADKVDPRNVARRTAETAKEKFLSTVRRMSGQTG
jgi:hypothetical protein